MTPRTEVDFLDASMTASRAAKQVSDSSHSRYPVAGRDEDDVLGFVHVRDLFLPNHPAGRAATVGDLVREVKRLPDRKSTRLNSSHANISYAVFCLKKKIIYS